MTGASGATKLGVGSEGKVEEQDTNKREVKIQKREKIPKGGRSKFMRMIVPKAKSFLKNPPYCACLFCVVATQIVDFRFCLRGSQPGTERLHCVQFPFVGGDDQVIAFGGQ